MQPTTGLAALDRSHGTEAAVSLHDSPQAPNSKSCVGLCIGVVTMSCKSCFIGGEAAGEKRKKMKSK